MQVKVKNSRDLKRYVSQNIRSNSWNSVFWPNLYSARLCYIDFYFLGFSLSVDSFSLINILFTIFLDFVAVGVAVI